MKISVISRARADYTRSRSQDLFKIRRNLDPKLHPFEQAREYTRALNAVKTERIFAKPFVGALSGHADGVYCLAKHPQQLTCIVSGSADGEVRVWNLSSRKCVWNVPAHRGFVRGVSITSGGDGILSVGDDKCIRLWSMDYDNRKWTAPVDNEPEAIFMGTSAYSAVDYHQKQEWFTTSSNQVDVWDVNRSEPIHTFSWGADTINSVRFNKTEVSVLASCGSDRNVVLYDIRSNSPLSKLILEMRSNSIAWNPMEAFNFTVANEDHNCYTFDMRKMNRALNVLKDHVSAVMDLDYSPTGQEIATGAYDRSLRIFRASDGHSRDIYHTKRMQRVFCVKFSHDDKYLISGSDDTNIRLWKAHASEPLATLPSRQRASIEYSNALKEKFKELPEIKRIARHRHVPQAIYKASQTKRTMLQSIARKEDNERKHSKPGTVPHRSERKKHIIKVDS